MSEYLKIMYLFLIHAVWYGFKLPYKNADLHVVPQGCMFMLTHIFV